MGKSQIILTIILFNFFFIAFVIAIITFVRQYKLKKKEYIVLISNQFAEHQKELLSTQIEIQTQTMQHIGREIHDNIGQQLTLASLYTQQLAFENKAPHITENIENISKIINSSLSELRQLSKTLTDNTIENKNLVSLLKTECRKVNEFKNCEFTFSKEANKLQFSYETKSFLVRIVQEFLQNSLKHSDCKKINVHLQTDENNLILSLKDDGKGFDTNENKSGIGLKNIKKRTAMLEGTFDIKSNKNGTNLTIKIPI